MVKRIGIAVAVLGLIFAVVKYFSNKSVEAAVAAQPVFKTTAIEIADKGNKSEAFLSPYLNQVIALDGILCEYYSVADGECFLELTAGVQKDSCFVVARPLVVNTLTSQQQWSACDSAMVRTHNLYNLQEHHHKLFVKVELAFMDEVNLQKFSYNKKCNFYNRYYNENTHRLENFCIDKVSLKAKLNAIKVLGDSTYLSFNEGVLLTQEKLNHSAHYRKRL